jgi:hypothetical protein
LNEKKASVLRATLTLGRPTYQIRLGEDDSGIESCKENSAKLKSVSGSHSAGAFLPRQRCPLAQIDPEWQENGERGT